MRNLIGTTIGVYELVEEIGRGAMAVVFKARQPQLDRWVAVKVLEPAYTGHGAQMLKRFKQEALTVANLRHPNILTVHDCGEQDGLEYIVMEYVEGGTLKDRLNGTPIAWRRAVLLAHGIALALSAAHEHDIIHRDVKPANVLMPRDDWPLLADFGLAKIKQAGAAISDLGMSLGTPAYISPEQALGEEIDHRADIYALGAVLFEMVTGRVLYQSSRQFEVIFAHITEPPPKPRALVSTIPEPLERVILKALEKNPDDRYFQMMDMVAALQALAPLTLSTRPTTGHLGENRPVIRSTTMLRSVRVPPRQPHFLVVGIGTPVIIPRKAEVVIGRSDPEGGVVVDVDLTVDAGSVAGSVSRQHARLRYSDNGWTIEDLQSTNGTYVNKEPIPPFETRPLMNGDAVDLGQMALTFHSGEPDRE
jgi:serine/threonine protein kinase